MRANTTALYSVDGDLSGSVISDHRLRRVVAAITIVMQLLFALVNPGYAQIPGGIGVSTSLTGLYSIATTTGACVKSGACPFSTVTPSICNPPPEILVEAHVANAQALVTSLANACIAYMDNVLQSLFNACPAGYGFVEPIVAGPWDPVAVDPPPGSLGGGSGGLLTSAGIFKGSLTGQAGCSSANSTTVYTALVGATFSDWWCATGTFPLLAAPIYYCSTSPPVTVALFDPIADGLASGTGLVSNSAQLAAATHAVAGAAADNATQVLISVNSLNAGDQIQLTLSDEHGPSSDAAGTGYLTALPANGMDSRTSGGVITVDAVKTGSGTVLAFAVYHAPTDFVRGGNASDLMAKLRTINLGVSDITAGTTLTQPIGIVRPPVVLVHGLWGEPDDLIASGSGIYGALEGSQLFSTVAFARYDQPIIVEASNPSYGNDFSAKGNSLGFLNGANTILPKLESVVTGYKSNNPSGAAIAAVQVDIVAHSMGGNITRTLPQISGYADQKSYEVGYVHKLITLDTPHRGSPLATELHNPNDNNLCVQSLFALKGRYAFVNVQLTSGDLVNGATGDLEGGSAAIAAYLQGSVGIPTAMIGGEASAAQFAGAGSASSSGGVLKVACFSNPLAKDLTPAGWRALMGGPSDAVVPLTSQFNNETGYENSTNTFQGVVHGSGAESLGFLPPSILDYSSGVPTAVVTLLNTPVSDTAVFELIP